MGVRRTMPGRCILCGGERGVRVDGRWRCAACGWRVGDVPDPELPRPRVDVVYYLRYAERIKIGTTFEPKKRLRAIRHDELIAFERGDRTVERARHAEFAALREGGEWFTATPELISLATRLRGDVDPWHRYARWVAESLAPLA